MNIESPIKNMQPTQFSFKPNDTESSRRNLTEDTTKKNTARSRSYRPLTKKEKRNLTAGLCTIIIVILFTILHIFGSIPFQSQIGCIRHVFLNPMPLIFVASNSIIYVPKTIICTFTTCESSQKSRLRTIAAIVTDATSDVSAFKTFTVLVSDIGKPLVLNKAARYIASDDRDPDGSWRDEYGRRILTDLSAKYLQAHEEVKAMVSQSAKVVTWTSKYFIEFGEYLTDQIPAEERERIDLPSGWNIDIPKTRKHSEKSLKRYYKDIRIATSKIYLQLLQKIDKTERSISTVLEDTRGINDANIAELQSTIDVVDPLLKSISELRGYVSYVVSYYETENKYSDTSDDSVFNFKWKVESFWASLLTLEGSPIGRRRALQTVGRIPN